MAMAREPPDLTGKMGGLAVGSDCDLCGATKPIKYCGECNVKLCLICTKGHGVLPTTRDHSLLDLAMLRSGSSYAKSGDAESGPSPCVKHSQQFLEFHCQDCKFLICRECRKDHNGHSIKALKDDVKIYQAICTEHIKSLLDKSHELEGSKSLVGGIFAGYNEAISLVKKWEKELIELVEECSRSLREDLEKTKKEWENILNDNNKGLDATLGKVENKISKLHSIRKVSDIDLFSHELATAQQLLENVNHFIKNVLPKLTVPKVNEILPNMPKLPKVKSGITILMSRNKGDTATANYTAAMVKANINDGKPKTTIPATISTSKLRRDCPPNLYSLSQLSNFEIPDAKRGGNGYNISESYVDNAHVLLHGSGKRDIRMLNLANNSFECHRSQCEVWDIISTGFNEYVAVMYNEMILLNSKFEIVETRITDKKYCNGVSYLGQHRFVLMETDKMSDQWSAHLSIVEIRDGQFHIKTSHSLDVADMMLHATTDAKKKNVYMFSHEHLYKVYLEDGNTEHKDVSSWGTQIWSLCAVGENILLGRNDGIVSVLDKNLNYERDILKVVGVVTSIAVVIDKILITTRDNNIYVFQ